MILLSPAKSLDWETPIPIKVKKYYPHFTEETETLAKELQNYSQNELKQMMKVSSSIAELNYTRYQKWEEQETRMAIYTFKGDVYKGLNIYSIKEENLDFCQNYLRILSGIYGLLRPFEQIKAYRLEMGTKFLKGQFSNLYEFWGEKITKLLLKDAKKHNSNFIVNLASNEYFSAIHSQAISLPIITPKFYDYRNKQFKIISFLAKKARGAMASFIIKNEIKDKKKLKDFSWQGYKFYEERENCLFFKRKQ